MSLVTPRPNAQPMPDVAGDAAAAARALDWVGMHNIALPLRLRGDDGAVLQVPASVDVLVDLSSICAIPMRAASICRGSIGNCRTRWSKKR